MAQEVQEKKMKKQTGESMIGTCSQTREKKIFRSIPKFAFCKVDFEKFIPRFAKGCFPDK